jgi:hypothetical protein
MSQSTVFIVMRGEASEGGTIKDVFATHQAASEWVTTAFIPNAYALHPEGWKVVEVLEGLPLRWECGIDYVEIETWKVRP